MCARAVPAGVKAAWMNGWRWLHEDGMIFRGVTHSDNVWVRVSEAVVGGSLSHAAEKAPSRKVAPMTCAVPVPGSAIQPVGALSRFSSYWDIRQ